MRKFHLHYMNDAILQQLVAEIPLGQNFLKKDLAAVETGLGIPNDGTNPVTLTPATPSAPAGTRPLAPSMRGPSTRWPRARGPRQQGASRRLACAHGLSS